MGVVTGQFGGAGDPFRRALDPAADRRIEIGGAVGGEARRHLAALVRPDGAGLDDNRAFADGGAGLSAARGLLMIRRDARTPRCTIFQCAHKISACLRNLARLLLHHCLGRNEEQRDVVA